MIELHRLANDEFSDEIDRKMNDMVLAYKTRLYDTQADSKFPLPCIRENDTLVTEEPEIREYLRILEDELRLQRSVTGDGCYIDPQSGTIC